MNEREPDMLTPANHVIDPALAAELFEQSLQIVPTLGMRDAAARLLAPLVQATDATRASIMLVNPDTGRLRIVAATGMRQELIGRDAPYRPKSISEWVFRHHEGLVMHGEVKTESMTGTSETPQESSMSLPLEGTSGVIGVLNLARLGMNRLFTDAEMQAVLEVLPPVAAALERARSAEYAEQLGVQLRQSAGLAGRTLLPHGLFEARHYEFGFARRSSALEGGDVCERAPHANGGHSLMSADVAGDGVHAVLTAAFLQGLFVASAAPERSTSGMIARLNAELHQRGGGLHHATMWVGQLSPGGQLSSCNAGAPAPLWVPADGSDVVRLQSGGPPVGMLTQSKWDEESVRLLPGDLLLVVSDGVVQARNAVGRAFGDERLAELALDQRRQPLDALAQSVIQAVIEWSGRPVPADDLSVLAVRFSPGD